MSTEFLRSLSRVNRKDRQTRVCEFFLVHTKGIAAPHRLCLGWIESADVDGGRLYYYRLPEGVLEIEVMPDGNDDYTRRVTDFITNKRDIYDMLGQESTPQPEAPAQTPPAAQPAAPTTTSRYTVFSGGQ